MPWIVTHRLAVEGVTCAEFARWLGDPDAPNVGLWLDDCYVRLLAEDGEEVPEPVDWQAQFKINNFRLDLASACMSAPTDTPAWRVALELYRAAPERYR